METSEIIIPREVNKIGIFADLHARDDKLYKLVNKHKDINHWFCVGDALDIFAPKMDILPTIRLIIKYNIKNILGNHELYILSRNEKMIMFQGEPDLERFLRTIQFSVRILYNNKIITLIHSTPLGVDEYISPEADDAEYEKVFANVNSDLIVLGNSHKKFIRNLKNKKIINPGALGGPFSSYLIIDKNMNIIFMELEL